MEKPTISPDFTVEDIHKIREYHYEITKNMDMDTVLDFYQQGSKEFNILLQERKRLKQQQSLQQAI